ncbi:nucleotidyltransferase domain-containing protein [Zhongshania sp.]|uniref:nucleotidyltransferase domain-containing protein n=1 Tax=Zhongshania sp. TaxID=1971902 RepID=UPI0039E69F41
MDKFKAIQILNEYIQKNQLKKFKSRLYLFGSIIQSNKNISDVDLLITYEDTQELQGLKKMINALEHRLPLDVIYMSIEEEEEFNFIIQQRAVKFEKWLNKAFLVGNFAPLRSVKFR